MCKHLGWEETLALLFSPFRCFFVGYHPTQLPRRAGSRNDAREMHKETRQRRWRAQDNVGREQNEWERRKNIEKGTKISTKFAYVRNFVYLCRRI